MTSTLNKSAAKKNNMKNLSLTGARESMYKGLHSRGKKRLELLSCSLPVECEKDVDICFELLMDRMSRYRNKWGKLTKMSYFKVLIRQKNNQHVHALIVKPWIFPDKLIEMWQEITGLKSNIECKTVSKDKTDRKQMKKLVDYLILQSEKHESAITTFSHSVNWYDVAGRIEKYRERVVESSQESL